MSKQKAGSPVTITDTIPGSGSIRRKGAGEWLITQRRFGKGHDNNHNPTWVRIDNPAAAKRLRIHLKWAESGWMNLRTFAYLKRGRSYLRISGETTPVKTVYEFTAPAGVSYFGSVPWYSNEDGDRFIGRMCRKSPLCRMRVLGKTAEGRDIKSLVITREPSRRKKSNVLVLAREHAFESSGSFAVEATVRFLLGGKAPSEMLESYAFHCIPIINPDGVAHGTKLARTGPIKKYDLVWGALAADDPTCRAFRETVLSLRPACLITHHSYLPGMPAVITYEKQVAVAMLSELMTEGPRPASGWFVHRSEPHAPFLRYHCYQKFSTTVVATELPWWKRLPRDIEKQGVAVFKAAMKAHELKRPKK